MQCVLQTDISHEFWKGSICLAHFFVSARLPACDDPNHRSYVFGNIQAGHLVKFSIAIYQSGVLVKSKTFDEVVFLGTAKSKPDFKVGGNNPWGTYNDIETVLCGPGGGSFVNMTSISASLQEYYGIGHGMKVVPHAWSAGSDTAETINDVHVTASGQVALANIGVDNNQELW